VKNKNRDIKEDIVEVIFKRIEMIRNELDILSKKINLVNVGIEELIQISKLSSPNYLSYLNKTSDADYISEYVIIPRIKVLDKQRKRFIEEISNMEMRKGGEV